MDLPSYRDLKRQLGAGKLVTRVLARSQRSQFVQWERELTRIAGLVDGFCARLGPRNWIFHESLSLVKVEALLNETADPEESERRLIEVYRDFSTTRLCFRSLRKHEALRRRTHQIERAFQHYQNDQFDSCVMQLIAVMDGFVNDFEPEKRKGLAARLPEEMDAWDSVVGHHMGLTHVMETFTKTIRKRIDDEVFEVFRHGIMHGSVTNFDNVVVATKAWNMLFAVADWASATQKASIPPEPKPTWSELGSKLRHRSEVQKYERAFEPRFVPSTAEGFSQDPVVVRASEFLVAWERKRWALVAAFSPPAIARSAGKAAMFAKDTFDRFDLSNWTIQAVDHSTASSTEVQVAATVNGQSQTVKFRMALWAPDGNVGMPWQDGAVWKLAVWAPHTYF